MQGLKLLDVFVANYMPGQIHAHKYEIKKVIALLFSPQSNGILTILELEHQNFAAHLTKSLIAIRDDDTIESLSIRFLEESGLGEKERSLKELLYTRYKKADNHRLPTF